MTQTQPQSSACVAYRAAWCFAALCGLASCSGEPLNSPYSATQATDNTLYTSFAERPKHLDPAVSYASNEYALIANIYEPPFQYHYLKRPYALVPLTATRVPDPILLDASGTPLPAGSAPETAAFSAYDITIQPGIRFQPHPAFARTGNGEFVYHHLGADARYRRLDDFTQTGSRRLQAADYVYQIKRLAHPGVHSPITGLMSQFIVGLPELAAKLEPLADKGFIDLRDHDLAGARILDERRFRITIRGYYPQFIYWLAMPFFAPMPWEADRFYQQEILQKRNITLDWYPVGTGPYLLAHNDPNRRMEMVRNPNFRGEPYPHSGEPQDRELGLLDSAGKPMPFIDRVVFSLEKENIPIWNKFLQGYYDRSGILSDSFDQAISVSGSGDVTLTPQMQDKGIRLSTTAATSTMYFGFNMLDPVVGGDSERSRLLRQAITIAIDQEEAISIFRNGRGIAMQTPIPPGIFGHRSARDGVNEHVYDWRDGRAQRKPIAAARALLAAAGYPGGRDSATGAALVLYFDTPAAGPDAKAYLDWLRKQFAKIDLQLVVRATDYNRFQDKVRKGTFQLLQWGWNADYPDPENFLFLFYGPNGRTLHGGENTANFEHAEYDRLFEQMRIMPNGVQRQQVIDRMVAIIQHEAPWAGGLHPVDYALYHAWNSNVKPHSMANNTMKYQRIDAQLRAASRRAWNRPVWWPIIAVLVTASLALIPALRTLYRRNRVDALGRVAREGGAR